MDGQALDQPLCDEGTRKGRKSDQDGNGDHPGIDHAQTAAVFALHAGLDLPITPSIALTGRYTWAYTTATTFGSVPAGSPVSRHATDDNSFTGGMRIYLN